jgi:hypothetical protein
METINQIFAIWGQIKASKSAKALVRWMLIGAVVVSGANVLNNGVSLQLDTGVNYGSDK